MILSFATRSILGKIERVTYQRKVTKVKNTEPRIYIACLSCYNAGRLTGRWVDLLECEPGESLPTYCEDSTHEESAIHDSEGIPVPVPEHESIADLITIAHLADDRGTEAVWHYWADFWSSPVEDGHELGQSFDDAFIGECGTEEDEQAAWYEDRYRDCMEVPEHLSYYIDWGAMARDAQMNGEWSESGGFAFDPRA